jgi:N-acetylmuramoyl-L-alanine amidase
LLPSRRHIAARLILALLAISLTASAQQPRTLVFIDPAHGGPDTGAHLPNNVLEKDVTLALATHLKTALAAAGFPVITTRDSDPSAALPTDQRAGIANHARPAICLVLHATDSGAGVHIITSALPASNEPPHILPWDTAQAASIPQSLQLANTLGLALQHVSLPVLLARASVHPLDNLNCPAIAIEIAPLLNPGADPTPVTDPAYQQRILSAITSALISWRTHIALAAGAAQ